MLCRVRTVFGGFPGGPGLMTQYFQVPDLDVAAVQSQNMIDRIRDACAAGIGMWPPQFTWAVDPAIDVIDPGNGALLGTVVGIARNGTGLTGNPGFGPGPAGIQIRWATQGIVAGRRVTGGTYMVPVTRSFDDNGTPNEGIRAAGMAFGNAVLNPGFGNPELYVWSRPFDGAPAVAGPPARPARPARPGTAHRVVGASVKDSFAVLRSRRD